MDTELRQAAEDQPEKEKIVILETIVDKCSGTVKWYSHKLLYGFISRSDNQEDVFVHRSAISAAANIKSPNLRNGEEVEFSVVRTNNGIEACNVTGPAGAPVQGFTLKHRRTRRRPRGGPNPDGEANGDGPEEGGQSGDDKHAEGDRPAGVRRRPRRRPPRSQHANGDVNGTGHSEGEEVYYDTGAAENNSPKAGQARARPNGFNRGGGTRGMHPRGRGGASRGGGYAYRRGGRGGKRGGGAATEGVAAE